MKTNGSLWGLGKDAHGQLGTGRALWRTIPYQVTNPDTNAGVQSYTIHGGPDAALFEINATSGELSFQTTPDFESLQDANGDNLFEVIVRATDTANLFSDQTVYITLNDINEAPTFGGSDTITLPESTTTTSIFPTWDRTFGGSGEDKLANTIKTSDGGYLLAGRSESNASGEKSQDSRGGRDYWVVKLDATGNKVWDRTVWRKCEKIYAMEPWRYPAEAI